MIKLSDAVQKLPNQVTCNVHGVGSNFLAVGRQRRAATAAEYGGRRFTKVCLGARRGWVGGVCAEDGTPQRRLWRAWAQAAPAPR